MYRGIWNLRSVDDDIILTDEQRNEIDRCSKDAVYFMQRYCYISTKEQGLSLFPLYPREVTEIETLNTEKMIKGDWYRQAGYTTLVMVYMLWKALFNPNTRCLYVTPKKALARELFNEKIRQVYLSLPLWMQCGVKMFSYNCIILGNNSALHSRAATYDNVDPSGGPWDYIFIDNFGWLRDMDMIKIANGLFPVAVESKRMHIILGASHKFGRQSPANLLFWSNNKFPFVTSEFMLHQDDRHDNEWAQNELLRVGRKHFQHMYEGYISKDAVHTEIQSTDKWNDCENGRMPSPYDSTTRRFLCMIVKFRYDTGLPDTSPYSKVLTIDNNGQFNDLVSDSISYEKIIAWMPEPAFPMKIMARYA